jgi:hypothetical protein
MHIEARIRRTLCLLSFFLIILLATSFAVTGCGEKEKADSNEIVALEEAVLPEEDTGPTALETAESDIAEVASRHGCTVSGTPVIIYDIWVKMKIPYGASEDAMVEEFLKEPIVLHAEKDGLASPY